MVRETSPATTGHLPGVGLLLLGPLARSTRAATSSLRTLDTGCAGPEPSLAVEAAQGSLC